VSYEAIFIINSKAFATGGRNTSFTYGTDDWEVFKNTTNFNEAAALFSNNNNPIYTNLSQEAKDFLENKAHGIYPFDFIRYIDFFIDMLLKINYTSYKIQRLKPSI
jgi:hypothetical protein